MRARIGGKRLLVLQLRQELEPRRHAASKPPPNAIERAP
jgi:hypothetical protein